MTVDDARAIWAEHTQGLEGWLDTQVRIEGDRALTTQEAEAAEILWSDFCEAMEQAAQFARVRK